MSLRNRMSPWLQRSWRVLTSLVPGSFQHPAYVQAAHYFADGWSLNMWQVMRPEGIAGDLKKIREDGFNTIILVVPWRGLQKIDRAEYDEFYLQQLSRVMSEAERQRLSVIVRVAYSHQILIEEAPDSVIQGQRLLTDESVQALWLDGLAKVHEVCSGYRSYRQGFLCWEELWHAFAWWQRLPEDKRRDWFEPSGYADYLKQQNIQTDKIIPTKEEAAHQYFHAFANARLRSFYDLAATVFPGLSMEFRVDKDPLFEGDEITWLSNDNYADLSTSRYSYWAPFMGAANEGEVLDVTAAAGLLAYMLGEVSDQGEHCNHIVDQFNFVDDSPKFRGIHASISSEDIPDFLHAAAPLLRQNSAGYGVWAYRDYHQNLLFNPSFLMGMRGWQVREGHCELVPGVGVTMTQDAMLEQFLPSPVAGLQSAVPFETLTLRIECDSSAVQVRINKGDWQELSVDEATGELVAEIPVVRRQILRKGLRLELACSGSAVKIRGLNLYGYTYIAGLRTVNGDPAEHHAALVTFNRESAALTQVDGEN
ncbi:MAG: hypothetical protein V7746_11100 [Halioglobus sp.]